MPSNHHHSGIAWVTLVAVVVGFQPWDAMARSGSAASDRYTPRSSSAKNPSRQYIIIPAAPAALPAAKIPVIQKSVSPVPTVAPAGPVTYDQLRGAAVEAELNAQKAQSSYNSAAAAYNMESSNIKAFAQKAGYAGLLHPPLGTPVTGPRWKGFDEVSKPQVRGGLAVTDGSIDVRPCNQILGITLPSWTGRQSFKTSDGKTFSTYDEAKSYVLKADYLSHLTINKRTGSAQSSSTLSDSYSKCLEIEGMSADLDFSKKLLDEIALKDAVAWHFVIEKYSVATLKKQEATQAWQAAEAKLIDLIAKMILKAEASDPKLEGLAIDAYGFWLASKLRYHYMTGYSKSLLPSESAIFDTLQIQKIFQDYSNGSVDTAAYRTSLQDLYNFATGPAALLRLDRAFGFAAAYAASLKSQLTLTERVAQAAKVAADKAAAEKAASSKSANSSAWNLISAKPSQGFNKAFSQTTTLAGDNQAQLQVPALPPSDPMVSALSSRLTEVLFMLAVPVLDRTKLYGVTPTWLFITNTAFQLDNYFFALKDQSKSAVVMNGGFDIYDNVAGWHKMQVKWVPIHTPQSFFHNEVDHVYEYKGNVGAAKTKANWSIAYPADGSCPHVEGVRSWPTNGIKEYFIKALEIHDLFADCTKYMATKLVSDSYLAKDPIYEVLSQSAKVLGTPLSSLLPKKILEAVTNAFGVSAFNMLSAHHEFPTTNYCAYGKASYNEVLCSTSKEYKSLLELKNNSSDFADYVMKGLQADKAAGYPVGTFSKRMQNFTSVAMLFHPVSVGFGSCSIYETLFSPYNTLLGYSCIDYMRPLLELYKPSQKTSSLFRDLKRLNQWVVDQIIPNANAESIGITKSDDGGGDSGGGAIAVIATMVLNYFGFGSDGGGGGGGSGGGAKSATEIQQASEAQTAADQKSAQQMEAAEAKQIEDGQKTIEKYLEGAQQVAKVVSDWLKKLFELPPIDSKEFAAINPNDKAAMAGKDLANNAPAKSPEAGELEEQAIIIQPAIVTMNDRPITAPINYNGKMYFPKVVYGVSQSQYVPFGGATWYAKQVSVTYQSPDGSEVTEVDTFLYTDYQIKVGEEKTIIQGVYKVVLMEGNDTDNVTTIFLNLEVKGPDGEIRKMPDGSEVLIDAKVIDEAFGVSGEQDTDPAAAQALQDLLDAWKKKHP